MKNVLFCQLQKKIDTNDDEIVIDTSHESLLRQWNRLKEWMVEEFESARKLRWLSDSVLQKREPLRGVDLKDAVEWAEKQNHNRIWASRYVQNFTEIKRYVKTSSDKFKESKRNGAILKTSFVALLLVVISLFLWKKQTEVNVLQKKISRDSVLTRNSRQLMATMKYFEDLSVDDKTAVRNTYKKMMTSYDQSVLLYEEILKNKDSSIPELIVLMNEWQGINFQINNLLMNKIDAKKNWETNSYIYKSAAKLYAKNLELGKKKFELDPTLPNKVDYSTRFGAFGYKQLFIKDFKGAILSSNRGLELYPLNDWIKTYLASALLLDGQFDEAEKIYSKYKNAAYVNKQNSFKAAFLRNLQNLEEKGVINKDDKVLFGNVQKIRMFLLGD